MDEQEKKLIALQIQMIADDGKAGRYYGMLRGVSERAQVVDFALSQSKIISAGGANIGIGAVVLTPVKPEKHVDRPFVFLSIGASLPAELPLHSILPSGKLIFPNGVPVYGFELIDGAQDFWTSELTRLGVPAAA